MLPIRPLNGGSGGANGGQSITPSNPASPVPIVNQTDPPSKPKILIISSQDHISGFLKMVLQARYEIVIVKNINKANNILSPQNIALIFCNIRLVEGIIFARERSQDIPIIFMGVNLKDLKENGVFDGIQNIDFWDKKDIDYTHAADLAEKYLP